MMNEKALKSPEIHLCINALLLPKNLGGIGNYTFHLIKSLIAAYPNLKISLLINNQASYAFGILNGIEVLDVNIRSRLGRLLYLHFIFPFKVRKYEILHSIGNMGLVICPTPQVITVHDVYERVSPERFSLSKRILMRCLVSASGFVAKKILTDSNNSARDLAKFYPHLRKKLSVIYLGNKFPISNILKVEQRNGFLFLGTIEPGKNIDLVLKAYAKFIRVNPEGGRLRIIGADGWKQAGLPTLIARLEIPETVDFLGYVADEDLPKYFASALALIQASSYEGFGLPVIEAMACGCPVIAARNSGLIEAGGNSAVFFETGNAEELFQKMEVLFTSKATRQQCIVSGFAHAAQFTWENTAQQTYLEYFDIKTSALRKP